MTEILKTQGICRDFKSGNETIQALKNISFNVKSGTLTILRGRSGSGKTTLINLLGAMDMPSNGEIYFDGENITNMTEIKRDMLRRKRMGFVFQSGALMSYMSAYENVDFALRIAGFNTKERGIRAEECLAIVGLSKRKEHRPSEMSGGEQQRVAIARAISHRPKIIFADEPTSALDSSMSIQIVKAFKEIIDREGTTVVMTTHDPSMIEIADQVITLQDGEMMNE
ncbi:ABC transporter ATP-binding protein [Clostridium estertheticum]|uniref:ABC transporter ATP-binding protein n=1 Tax=Clostridium estertheticum TaxID=238834 RepID=UPI0013E95C81|nr:ABC transporter ATP-binding protein [Clostridium estertheticum]MBZ9686003.1 ABC transporter ATP-binding protein [Clostridium estertheticum]